MLIISLITDIVKSIAVIPEEIVRSVYEKECNQMLHVEERILINEINKIKREEAEKKSSILQMHSFPKTVLSTLRKGSSCNN